MENENLKSKLKDAQAKIDGSGLSEIKKDLEELNSDMKDGIHGGKKEEGSLPGCECFLCSVYT